MGEEGVFTFLILPQWHLHYPYMPLVPKENLSHHGKIVLCDEYVNCFVKFFVMFSFCLFFMILSYGDLNSSWFCFVLLGYCIGSNFWKFYLIRIGFTLGQPDFFGESVYCLVLVGTLTLHTTFFFLVCSCFCPTFTLAFYIVSQNSFLLFIVGELSSPWFIYLLYCCENFGSCFFTLLFIIYLFLFYFFIVLLSQGMNSSSNFDIIYFPLSWYQTFHITLFLFCFHFLE